MADIVATYAVHAGTTATVRLGDVTDPDMVALYLSDDVQPDVSVCHECADNIIDPEVAHLVSFTVDGVAYEQDKETGHWVESKPSFRITLAEYGGHPR